MSSPADAQVSMPDSRQWCHDARSGDTTAGWLAGDWRFSRLDFAEQRSRGETARLVGGETARLVDGGSRAA